MPLKRSSGLLSVLAVMLLTLGGGSVRAGPVIAAAADLQFALEELADAFREQSGHSVRLSFGSSGTFATQIRHGAPFELYLSADEDYVFGLHADGLTRDRGTLYAIGRLALVVPTASDLPLDGELKGLAQRVTAGRIRRFAIANPEHAPYGRRAEEALRHAGLWQALAPRLVLGENVSQAAQFATGGSADGGIVALSLAMSPQFGSRGRYAVIPEDWHKPLRQRMVLLDSAGPVAVAFHAYLQSPPARQTMRRYGFALPGEAD
jgi:molybdate transport system substrate-binding protein